MSGVAPSELILICLIALMILGPERLPPLARKLGGWLGKARQMTRSLQRQLEEETSVQKNFGFDPKDLDPTALITPREDDTYSPLHDESDEDDLEVGAGTSEAADIAKTDSNNEDSTNESEASDDPVDEEAQEKPAP